jgi:hypothetical protein
MAVQIKHPAVYEGDGDLLMQKERAEGAERLVLIPDALPSKTPDPTNRIRILWGQHLLEDLLAGRYRSLVCAVNSEDNSHGIISQLATLLPTSQWDEDSITAHARHFDALGSNRPKVVKYDMDTVEVLALLRPASHEHLTLEDLRTAFRVVAEMVNARSGRRPSASVSFLDARANRLSGPGGEEPSFEAVLAAMYEAGYTGDVYPAPSMWHLGPVGLYPRYPFSPALDQLRSGGF